MRKLVTAAAAAAALSLSLAAPALADHNDNRGPGSNQTYNDDNYGDRTRGGRDDFGRSEQRLDRWERGWRDGGYRDRNYGDHRVLSQWQLVRRLERQGYYGVRGLRPSRHGFGWRAFAYTGRGRPVMIRVNPYTGRVLDVRPIWS